MIPSWFPKYLASFEHKVALLSVLAGYGCSGLEPISLRKGKLEDTSFGRLLGEEVDTEFIFAIDYYGYYKKSRGCLRLIERFQASLNGVRAARIPVVHFASIRGDAVARLAPDLIKNFHEFKSILLEVRGFQAKWQTSAL